MLLDISQHFTSSFPRLTNDLRLWNLIILVSPYTTSLQRRKRNGRKLWKRFPLHIFLILQDSRAKAKVALHEVAIQSSSIHNCCFCSSHCWPTTRKLPSIMKKFQVFHTNPYGAFDVDQVRFFVVYSHIFAQQTGCIHRSMLFRQIFCKHTMWTRSPYASLWKFTKLNKSMYEVFPYP